MPSKYSPKGNDKFGKKRRYKKGWNRKKNEEEEPTSRSTTTLEQPQPDTIPIVNNESAVDSLDLPSTSAASVDVELPPEPCQSRFYLPVDCDHT